MEMFEVASSSKSQIILMHMKGNPRNMMDNSNYSDLTNEICKYFSEKIEQLSDVFFGTDEHADISKNEIKTINFFDRITN